MTATSSSAVHKTACVATMRGCRAYGGPAHGCFWVIGAGAAPPAAVDVGGESNVVYRLIGHPRTGAPAMDHLGNYLYMPVVPGATSIGSAHEADAPVHMVSGAFVGSELTPKVDGEIWTVTPGRLGVRGSHLAQHAARLGAQPSSFDYARVRAGARPFRKTAY
ncbi:hypothetical protein EV648_110294 [Kribbella sp. VKM Ac-2568]|nr:hypothetical protein EV648_110294 [Kribbella sp. VKM Ac-2568]